MTVFKNLAVNKDITSKENFVHNYFSNILRLFDVLPNFRFTTSDYYL